MDSQLGDLKKKKWEFPDDTPQKIDFGANQFLLIAVTKKLLKSN